jgi:hypothetical protein
MVGKKQDYEFVSGNYGYGDKSSPDTKIFVLTKNALGRCSNPI